MADFKKPLLFWIELFLRAAKWLDDNPDHPLPIDDWHSDNLNIEHAYASNNEPNRQPNQHEPDMPKRRSRERRKPTCNPENRRQHHNNMERERRESLRVSYEQLKREICQTDCAAAIDLILHKVSERRILDAAFQTIAELSEKTNDLETVYELVDNRRRVLLQTLNDLEDRTVATQKPRTLSDDEDVSEEVDVVKVCDMEDEDLASRHMEEDPMRCTMEDDLRSESEGYETGNDSIGSSHSPTSVFAHTFSL